MPVISLHHASELRVGDVVIGDREDDPLYPRPLVVKVKNTFCVGAVESAGVLTIFESGEQADYFIHFPATVIRHADS